LISDSFNPIASKQEPQEPNRENSPGDALNRVDGLSMSVLDALTARIAVLDGSGVVTTVNRAWKESAQANTRTGSTNSFCEGADYLRVCDSAKGPDSGEALAMADGIRSVLRGEQAEYKLEYPCHSPRSQAWFLVRVTPFGAKGQGLVVSHEDVTRRHLAEDANRAITADLRAALESTDDAVYLVAPDFTLRSVNQAAARRLAHPVEDLVGKPLLGILNDEAVERRRIFLERTVSTGERQSFQDKRGGRWVEDRITPVLEGEGQVARLSIYSRDITDLKKADESLREALSWNRNLLRELQHRAKNSFSMIVSMIRLAAVPDLSKETKAILEELSQRVMSVAALYSLLYSGGSSDEVRLDDYCRKVIDAIGAFAHGTSLEGDFENLVAPATKAAPLGLILTELVTNAFKNAFPGEMRGRVRASLRATPDGALLEVSDDGVGLPEGFDPEAGTGTGLILVAGLANQIGGKLGFSSRGKGASFVVEFRL
jgi:PAS domain S-box-containing protein